MAEWQTLMAAGCIHAPIHNKDLFQRFVDAVAKEQPDHVLLLGDTIECDALSKYDSDLDFSMLEEFEAENAIRKELRKAAPKARLVETTGNHDFMDRVGRMSKKLRSAMLSSYLYAVPELEHWTVLPRVSGPQAVAWFGQVGGHHGFELGTNGDRNEALRLGVQNGLMLRAHSHRPEYRSRCKVTTNTAVDIAYANVGTMCDLRLFKEKHYARTINTSQWGCRPVKVSFNPQRKMFTTKQWDIEPIFQTGEYVDQF